ncbi:hypothetical protein ACWD4N_48775, partial [Streptomyces sp. NPDC002586]
MSASLLFRPASWEHAVVAAPDDGLTVDLHASAAEFDADQWDALVGPDGFYTGHRWIRSLELVHGPQPVLAATAGGLRGVLPVWTSFDSGGLFGLSDMTQQLVPTPSRQMLWLGPRRATAAAIACTRDAMRPRILHALPGQQGGLARAGGPGDEPVRDQAQ